MTRARTRPRPRPLPPGKRPSKLPPCTWVPGDPATAPGPDERPACGTCGLPYSHVRHHHEATPEVHDAQAEHRRRSGEREE
jgi:hypothetical protein